MSDLIFVKGLVLHAHHGVMAHEGEVGQRFVVDLELKADLDEAAASDRLANTISYAAVVEEAQRAFVRRKFKLVEAAAGAVAQALLERFARVEEVRVVVHKPHAPIAAIFDDVGVALTRRRER
ncbi:MAG TPA: dihydroneopterin aldolase [Roseiarcus sp.]|nr:dihydroneopterin aldolase [Roseiarcus sp.]